MLVECFVGLVEYFLVDFVVGLGESFFGLVVVEVLVGD